ncbi:DUF2529 family protein [Fictibacillus aquaticus]|uniref:DUF2529 domain-containing protein n=1 Tax=Fictibacillus aquaticus TaxID=2021314 RepID=A0A235F8Y6_9BACL|nr:DUF2529 family protein [Fictibacillus aquaticus]OYD57407.1 hypothetical protein CGZ90_12055 [Fictibacillus aquaticus]
MLKIFSTQLAGIFQNIEKSSEEAVEDAARLLAQSLVSDGTVYFHGTDEMMAVAYEGVTGPNAIPSSHFYDEKTALTAMDTVIVSARFAACEKSAAIAGAAREAGTRTIFIGAAEKGTDLDSLPYDVVLDTKAVRGLIPQDDGTRTALPSAICGLYVYQALHITVSEYLEEI